MYVSISERYSEQLHMHVKCKRGTRSEVSDLISDQKEIEARQNVIECI